MKNTIKVERAKNDLTQAELAKKVGVSRQTINSIEKSRYIPSTVLSLKIASIFDIAVDTLFALESEDWD
ncbi:helix-turn-helix transcriptional regulator [Pareuzebyella sediminis]|uniref:helix-turn-helix transcriptional regulator n=1 Tax=Pareuzebyella sediminis TaxID=2607998 RepID=UPI0011EBD199|nr:helix-turn-helix transcriptional regulator [Pareuzebyella sediminis]